MEHAEIIKRELRARRRKWRQISIETGVAYKTICRLHSAETSRPHRTTVELLLEYFNKHPVPAGHGSVAV